MSVQKKKQSKAIFETSVLIYYLTKFSGFIYRTFLAGFFGWILTSYEALSNGFSSSMLVRKIKSLSNYRVFHFVRKVKRYTAQTYEKSFFLTQIRNLSMRLLKAKVNTFGLFFFSYGFYLILIQVIRKYSVLPGSFLWKEAFIGCMFIGGGFFMLFSKRSLAGAVYDSTFLRWILFDCLGFPITDIAEAAQGEVIQFAAYNNCLLRKNL